MPLTHEQFNAAVSDCAPRLRRILLRLIGNREVAEERLQNVFIAAWIKRETFWSGDADVAPWLYAFARNEFLSYTRAEGRRRRLLEAMKHESGPANLHGTRRSVETGKLETMKHESGPANSHGSERAELEHLGSCLKALPLLKRRVISSFYGLEDPDFPDEAGSPARRTDEEIADMLSRDTGRHRGKGAVTMLRVRTLRDLRKCIASRSPGHGRNDSFALNEAPRPGPSDVASHPPESQLLRLFVSPDAPELEVSGLHLHRCVECREFIDDLYALEDALSAQAWKRVSDELDLEAEPLSGALRRRLLAIAEDGATLRSMDARVSRAFDPPFVRTWALAAAVLLSVGLWQLVRFAQSPRAPGGSMPQEEGPKWRGTPRERPRLAPPLQVVVRARATPVSGSWPSQAGESPVPPLVLEPGQVGEDRWRIEAPSRVPIQLYVLRPPHAMAWTARVECLRPGGKPLTLTPDGAGIWQGAGDSTDPDLPVGGPIDGAVLGLKEGDTLQCTVRRGAALEHVEIQLIPGRAANPRSPDPSPTETRRRGEE